MAGISFAVCILLCVCVVVLVLWLWLWSPILRAVVRVLSLPRNPEKEALEAVADQRKRDDSPVPQQKQRYPEETHSSQSSSDRQSVPSGEPPLPKKNGAPPPDVPLSGPPHLLYPDDLALLMNHLQPIAGHWKPFGLQLGLLPGELDTIAATPLLIPGGPAAYLQEVLKRWLNHALPFPTLSKLCDALRSHAMDQSRLALELEQQYQTQKAEARPVPMSSSSSNSQELQPVLRHKQSNANNASGSNTNVLESQSSFQQLSHSEQEELKAMLGEDARGLKRLFGRLVTKTRDSVEKRISVRKFAGSILELGAYEPAPEGRNSSLLDEHREEIIRAGSFEEIFIILNAYWNYLTYEVLEYIIELYGTDDDEKMLRSYDEELQKYCQRGIFELSVPPSGSSNGTGSALSQRQMKFSVKLNVREDVTCNDLLRIRIRIAKILHINMAALSIDRVDAGCVQLTFLIPKFIAQDIFPLSIEQASALSKNASVIRLECGDYVFENTEDQIETPSETHTVDQSDMTLKQEGPENSVVSAAAQTVKQTPLKTQEDSSASKPPSKDMLTFKGASVNPGSNSSTQFEQSQKPLETGSPTPTTTTSSFPYLNTSGRTPEQQERLKIRLCVESENIERNFSHLQSRVYESLRERSVPVDRLVTHLLSLRAFDPVLKGSQKPALQTFFRELRSAGSIEDVFWVIRDYFSFFNYRVIKHIVVELGTEQDRVELQNYEKEFDEYSKRRVYECPPVYGSVSKDDHVDLVVKVDSVYEEFTVKELEKFQYKLSTIFCVSPQSVLRLCQVEKGCLQLIFQVPSFVQQEIFPLSTEQESALAAEGVIRLTCGDYQFTAKENQKESKTQGDAYNMGSSFSHKVLEQHSNEIQQAIQFDLTQLVDELVVAGLVDMDTRNHLFNDPDADTARNARRLLTVVKGRVAQNPANFDKFTEALRESNQIDLAEKLERSARKHLKKFPVSKWLARLTIVVVAIAVATTTNLQLPIPSQLSIPSQLPPSQRIPCAKLQVQYGHVFQDEMEKGGTVQATIFCKEGFILKGKDTLICTKSGKWDGKVPKCIRIDCGPPPPIQDGSVQCSDTTSNGMAEYKCKKGFLLVGSSMMVCQSDGKTAKWSALDDTESAPVCKPMKCPDLENPMNGRINVTNQTVDSAAEYMCIDGFTLTGGDGVRICLAGGSWSGQAPLCEFGGEDKVAYRIQRKTNRLQEIAWSLKGQNDIAQALEDISSNLAISKLQAGMVGLMKSGKSSVLNALMKSETLPVAIQAETAVEVRIIHSTQYEHRNGVLFGENDDHTYDMIAESSDNIKERLRKFNKIVRNESTGNETTGEVLPHKSFVLRTPFHFLRAFKMKHTLQISDTAGPNEAGAFNATTKSKEAMKRLSALIIVLNYRALKDQGEIHLLTHLRDHHSHLLETKGRFLFVVNQIDAYHEEAHGDKYSIPPPDVPRYVQKYIKDNLGVEVPVEYIVPFSAKWALKSYLWSKNPASMSDVEYFSAMQLSCKFQGIEPPKGLRVPNEHNKIVVLNGLKLFSKIKELEAKLHQMLGNYGPEILYKGAIDDAVLHVGTLTEHIEEEKVNCNIGATQTDLQLHKDVKEELDTALAANKERRPKIPLEVDKNITTQLIVLTNKLTDSIYDKMLSLKLNEQNVEMVIQTLKEHNLKRQILETAESKMEKHWPQIMGTTIRIVKEETSMMLSAFKRDLEERVHRFDGIELELDEIELAKLEPLSPPFMLVLSVSPNKSLKNTKDILWDLALDLAVQFQERVKTEATKLSFTTAGQVERAAQQSVSKFRQKIQKEILRLTDELESKQEFIESLNQKFNELQTISDQLKGARDKIEMSLLDEIE